MQSTKVAPNARPVLHFPKSPFEIALEVAALAGIFTFAWMMFSTYASLPEQVPRHFDFSGKADAWGSKKVLFFLFVLICVLYSGLSILSRYPHIYNYPWPITPQNAEAQYRLARTMLGALKTIMVWMFTYMAWQTTQIARGNAEGLNAAFLIISLTLLFGALGIYFVKAVQAR